MLCEYQKCTACKACYNICNKQAISFNIIDGFEYPVIDESRCISCGACENVCPENKIPSTSVGKQIVVAAFNKNKDIRDASSSGGIFYSIATAIINQGGVVYGAAWDKNCVNHVRIDCIEELSILQGSKYVQSDIGDCLRTVRQDLREGRKVLFSGVPCQIAGLNSFLTKDYKNLVTCEVLCHGNASPEILKEHIKYVSKREGRKVTNINFRYKTNIRPQNIMWRFEDENQVLVTDPMDDYYYYGFQSGVLLRESCFSCKYVGTKRIADITLGDYWGMNPTLLSLEDDLTYPSLVFLNSNRGAALWEDTKKEFHYTISKMEDAIYGNLSLRRAIPKNKWRNKFFSLYQKKGYLIAANMYLHRKFSLKETIKKAIGPTVTKKLIRILKR